MKKFLSVPLFAAMALISQAWGAYTPCTADLGADYYCQWPTGCYQINKGQTDSDNCQTAFNSCKADGYLYTGVTTTGTGATCNGTWAGVGNDPNFNGGISIWCQWATGCEAIKTQDDLDNCKINGSVYKTVSSADVGANKTCKNSGTWTGDGKDPNAVLLGCCNWDGNGCFPVYNATDWGNCAAKYRYATCPGDEVGTCIGSPIGGGTSSSSSGGGYYPSSSSGGSYPNPQPGSSSSSGYSPIIIFYNGTAVTGLKVAHFARSLQIASGKDATVSLFDMHGKQVFSQRVFSGTTVIGLEKQRQGVYYAVVTSGSQKQTVKVILK